MIALKQLRLIACPCARDRQIVNVSHARLQASVVMPIAIILSLLAALIAHRSNKGIHFGFQHTDQCCAHRLLHFLPQQRCKSGLTFVLFLRIVLLVSHWYPPFVFY